jgi:hypothetical protein
MLGDVISLRVVTRKFPKLKQGSIRQLRIIVLHQALLIWLRILHYEFNGFPGEWCVLRKKILRKHVTWRDLSWIVG